MKRTLSLIALAALAATAGPVKVGGDLSGILNIPSLDPSVTGLTTKIGFGGKIAPAVEYALNDQVSFRLNAGFEYSTFGTEYDAGAFGKIKTDFTTQLVTLDVAAQYAIVPQVFVGLGVGYDIPVSAKAKDDEGESNIKGKQNSLALEATAGYKITPEIAVTAGYQFPLIGLAESTDAEGSKQTLKVGKVAVGVRYDLGL